MRPDMFEVIVERSRTGWLGDPRNPAGPTL